MPDSARRRAHAAALGLTILLMVLVAGSLLDRLTLARAILAALATAPLGYGWLRLRRRERRVYAWMTLLAVPYMALAATEAVANPAARAWAGACLFAAFALFVALIACLRTTR